MNVLFIILGVVLIVMSLVLLLVSPLAILGVALGVLTIIYARRKSKEPTEKPAEETVEQRPHKRPTMHYITINGVENLHGYKTGERDISRAALNEMADILEVNDKVFKNVYHIEKPITVEGENVYIDGALFGQIDPSRYEEVIAKGDVAKMYVDAEVGPYALVKRNREYDKENDPECYRFAYDYDEQTEPTAMLVIGIVR